jgi:hypothetical protein
MPWATSRVGRFFSNVGRTARDTADRNNDGQATWGEWGMMAGSALGQLATGMDFGGYGQRSIEAARNNFGRQAAPAPGPPGYNYRGNEVDSGPNPYVRPPDVPIQPAGDYTPGGAPEPTQRRRGWATGANTRTAGGTRRGGAYMSPNFVHPSSNVAAERSAMVTGGYDQGGLLGMGNRAVLGQSSLSIRNPTASNQVR